jgi:hypothetical protein
MEVGMKKVIDCLEKAIALTEALVILAVAPKHGAGELDPGDMQKLMQMLNSFCMEALDKARELI